MPFQYKPPENARKRKKYIKAELENAIGEIKEGASIRKTSIKYGIDRSTLKRYKLDEDKIHKFGDKNSQYKASQVFTITEEKLLVNYLLSCSKMHYGLTRKQAVQLAYEFVTANSKKFPDSWTTNNSAGKDWFRGFLCRNPEVSLRTPEPTSLSRATSFNKKNVEDFFTNLKTVLVRYKFEAHNIYNCDETGCTTVQNCPKVIANKKAKQVGQVTSAERGTTVTLCFAVNAIGNVIPPFFIFPRVRYQDHFVSEGPEGSDGDAYPSGWMTTKSLVKYLEHFVKYSSASETNRVLLILDNHESHVSIEVIRFAKNNGITLLTLPPHCSNKLQPLDVAVYSSFKPRYNTAMNNWMLSHPGKTITIYNIPGFIKTIMSQAFTQSNILSGFQKTGIYPFNPEIFDDDDFLCSAVTDRDLPQEHALTSAQIHIESQIEVATELEGSSQLAQNATFPIDFLQEFENNLSNIELGSVNQLSPGSPSILGIENESFQNVPDNAYGSSNGSKSNEMVTNARFSRASSEPNLNLRKQEIFIISSEPCTSKRATSVSSQREISFDSLKADPLTQNEHDNIILQSSSTAIMEPTQHNNLALFIASPVQSTSKDSKVLITPENVRPFPKAAPRKITRRGRQPGKTKILTMTPDKENCNNENLTATLTQEISNPNNDKCSIGTKLNNKCKTTQSNDMIRTQRIDSVKKRVFEKSDTEDDENYSIKIIRKTHGKTKGKKGMKVKQDGKQKDKKTKYVHNKTKPNKTKKEGKNKKYDSDTESDIEDVPLADSSSDDNFEENPDMADRWYCFVCETEDVMTMRLCLLCHRYVHEICVGLTEDIDYFICHECDQK